MQRFRTWFFLLNYYAHDFFTGVWGASFLVLALIRYRFGGRDWPVEAASMLGELASLFFWLEIGALVLLAVTGGLRAMDPGLGYRGAGAGREKRLFLVVKHLAMGALFLGGTLASYWWAHSF